MRPDIYTKAVLTIIAVALSVIALKPLINPDISVSAQSASLAGVQTGDGYSFFDPRTGEYFTYQYPLSSLGRDGHPHDGAKAEVVEKRRLIKLVDHLGHFVTEMR